MAWIMDYLSTHPCVDCGETDPIVLDFDHKDGEEKSFNLGDALNKRKMGIKRISEEVDKCVVRCANCHRRKTAKAAGFWKLKWDKITPQPFQRDCAGRKAAQETGVKLKRRGRKK
jgi:hypothetical protein